MKHIISSIAAVLLCSVGDCNAFVAPPTQLSSLSSSVSSACYSYNTNTNRVHPSTMISMMLSSSPSSKVVERNEIDELSKSSSSSASSSSTTTTAPSRRSFLAVIISSSLICSDVLSPPKANAATDCFSDCLKSCKLIAPKDPQYCQSNCQEYCAQPDRTDGLSGSVSSTGGEVGILGITTVVKGEDKPPKINLPGLDFTNDSGKKLIGY